jgi:Sec-independent protein translocase protein TatA
MSTAADPDGNGTHQSNVTAVDNLLKRNSDDVGWEYGTLVDAQNKDKVKCKFCGHESSGGVHRLKEHVAGVGKNVKKCRSMTDEAKEKCQKSLDESKRKRKEKTVRELELREEVNVSRVEEQEVEQTCVGSSQPHKLGPIDKWTRAIDPKATKSESLKQQKLNKALWQERTREVHKYIARWVYTHGN